MLEIKNVGFSYGSRDVLKDISFNVRRNEILSILGPNGTGKTTLLNCICNFNKQWSGQASIDGNDIRDMNSKEVAMNIGFVPQKAVSHRIRVFDAILIGRRPYIEWSATKEDMEIAWDAIEAMNLQGISQRFTNEISGGELQKVQIARALVQQPKVIILDEPTNNLDVHNQHMTMNAMIDAIQERGLSIVMTMHDINLSIQYSDSLLFMKDGLVAKAGSPDIVDSELIKSVYDLDMDVVEHDGMPFVIPKTTDILRRHKRCLEEST